MDIFQDKIDSAKKKLDDKGLYDPRLLVLALIAVIAVSVFWNGAKIVQQNYDLNLKAAEIQQENEVLELENRNKELQNEYLKTEEFAEITARRVFGKAAPGEKVYIVPKEVALNSLSQPAQAEPVDVIEDKPQYQQNLEAWLNIYFGN